MKKVFLGMSGGVDSSVAALLLKKRGYYVEGITLKLIDDYDDENILIAKKNCDEAGIKHHVFDLRKEFKKKVIDYFISDYLRGKTPNPCAVCNEEIKFAFLMKEMKKFDFDYIATGHYANIRKTKNGYFLTKGRDLKKTQEYFLARLKKEYLERIIFPLGGLTKDEVKKNALKNKLQIAEKESQEACFLKRNETPFEFIKKNEREKNFKTGLYTKDGKKIKDLEYSYYKYTIGQRKGLGVGGGEPLYVTGIDAKDEKVIVGNRSDVFKKSFIADRLNFFIDVKKEKFRADVKIRYLHKQSPAWIGIFDDTAKVIFDEPQFAITPGQIAVFYKKDAVLGSGFIADTDL